MRLFQGKKEAEKILLDLKKKIAREKVRPKLAVILVGDNPASKLYVKMKNRAARRVGISLVLRKFSSRAGEKRIIGEIRTLNQNKKIQGILVQLPLPGRYNADKIIKTIDPEKDVDRDVLPSTLYFAFKKGVRARLKSDFNLSRLKIIVLVNSKFFGETLKNFFFCRGLKINYFVVGRGRVSLKPADALITVLGCNQCIKGDMIKKGVILIDAGIPVDVDKESVKSRAAFLTPTPGGIGPLTVALLLKNVYKKAR